MSHLKTVFEWFPKPLVAFYIVTAIVYLTLALSLEILNALSGQSYMYNVFGALGVISAASAVCVTITYRWRYLRTQKAQIGKKQS
jgi:hypothetical protein